MNKSNALTTQDAITTLANDVIQEISEHYRQLGQLDNQAVSIILGISKAGKNSLINAAHLNTLSRHRTQHLLSIKTNSSVLLCFSGKLLQTDANTLLWTKLAIALKKHRSQKPFDNIILVCPVSYVSEATHAATAIVIRQLSRITPVAVPAYCILTQADTIAGFREFFDELSIDELKKAWGIILPETRQTLDDFKIQFEKRYLQFLKRLHENQIPRLHATRSPERRCLINEFPILLEQAMPTCLQFIQALFSDENAFGNIRPRAIFFTSTQQSAVVSQPISDVISEQTALTIVSKNPINVSEKAFFCHDIFHSIIPNDYTTSHTHTGYRRKLENRQFFGATSAAFTFVLGLSVLAYYYNDARQYINTAKANYTVLQDELAETSDNPLANQIPELVNLSFAQASFNRETSPLLTRFPNNHTEHLKKLSKILIEKNIQDKLGPKLRDVLAKRLKQDGLPIVERYHTLKAYLMFGDKKHFDITYLEKLLPKIITSEASGKALQHDMQILLNKVRQTVGPQQIDWQLVSKARKKLNAIPKPYLGMLLIKSLMAGSPQTINTKLFGQVKVPFEFTSTGFNDLISNQLEPVATELSHHAWVLDAHTLNEQQTTIASDIENLYANAYVQYWQLFVAKARPHRFDNLEAAHETFKALKQPNASIQTMVKLIVTNTQQMSDAHPASTTFNRLIARQLKSLAALGDAYLDSLPNLFNQIQQDIYRITRQKNKARAAFIETKKRFSAPENPSALGKLFLSQQHYPQPLQSWLGQIAQDTWYYQMQLSKDYLDKIWTQTVYRQYQRDIAGRYPFKKSSQTEIPLNKFDEFFANNGTLNRFFNLQLKPFLDTSSHTWRLKQIDGLSMPLTQRFVSELERANIIRHMFYDNSPQQAKVSFNLKTATLSDSVSSVMIDLMGKRSLDYPGSYKQTQFSWPNRNQAIAISRITVYDDQGESRSTTEKGTWGLFRLLDKAEVKPQANNTQKYTLRFSFKEGQVDYELAADNKLNPFIPKVLSAFSLPRHATG